MGPEFFSGAVMFFVAYNLICESEAPFVSDKPPKDLDFVPDDGGRVNRIVAVTATSIELVITHPRFLLT